VSARPGLVRTARIDRQVDQLVARAGSGDIAVIDVIDLDRATAEQLVSAGVSAVVNAAPSCSGRFPVHGPQVLLEAGVLLVDGVGGEVFARVRDGDTVRLDGASVYAAGECVVVGHVQSDESVAEANAAARDGLDARVGALVADAARRLGDDRGRILEGDGFPPLSTTMTDRVVVVVTAGATPRDLRAARRLVANGALVIAVGAGADIARDARLRPDLDVVGRTGGAAETVGRAREVLVLDGADLDAPVPTGIPRAHAISVGSPEDTAVLLAHTRGAALVVTCGIDESLGGVLDRSAIAGSMPLIGPLRGGGRHLSAEAVGVLKARGPRRLPRLTPIVLIAVLALAAGAALGAGPLRDTVGSGSGSTGATAAEHRAQLAQGRADASAAFDAAVAPTLMANKLTGHAATVVVLPGVSPSVSAGVVTALGAAKAGVIGPIALTGAYLDPVRTRILRDLAIQVAPTTATGSAPVSSARPTGGTTFVDPAVELDTLLAGALATTDRAQIGKPDPSTTTLLTGLSKVGGLILPSVGAASTGSSAARGDLVVLVVPRGGGAAANVRTAALARAFALRGRAVAVVAAGGRLGAASTGAVGVLRSATGTPTLSTIDDVGTVAGRVATVLALWSQLNGMVPGAFGVAGDAIGVVPSGPTASTGSTTPVGPSSGP